MPIWGIAVLLVYPMRRIDCRACGVKVERVPRAAGGQSPMTTAYAVFLARWAGRLSGQQTAEAFWTSWDRVEAAVKWVVDYGLAVLEQLGGRAGGGDVGGDDAVDVASSQAARGAA